ncbi:GH25 family lysozyme [Microbacterium rhizophilus]|uniref:GH25 family lysozyme n=1 Tax=Microbacterium rhizophilus TaxID=3138934 RepID=UPI0031EF89CF
MRDRLLGRRARLAVLVAAILAALGALAGFVASGLIWPGRILAAGIETRGVDVSSYQGDIDWRVLAGQGIDFAYIKATEGSSTVDSRFDANWDAARDTDLLVGAYHFLSFETPGLRQAEHVIDTVADDGSLPVAVDVEFYGDFFDAPPTRATVDAILAPLLQRLEEHYGVPPVIYATPDAYRRYISGGYADNPIWIRSVVLPPVLDDRRDWTLWQYSHRDRLTGYEGDEAYIDMNAFRGSPAELRALGDRG